ncbi:hypothetical protein Mlaev_01069 [Microbacterium laevaniformans]|uniref:Uncharacterized protein n=1 Tax=Microbacterium laevaniformans TaxID=36807 RepID=A0A150HGA1_9MICO|nr:hypothetical protein [Microbacterium laevaniformans]KXZ60818.1 hypothetical protein Mlaev_01069 [Microbacterium laevaniformans]
MSTLPEIGPSSEGEDWLYWDVPARTWRRVVLLVVPSEAPKRVRIQHLDPKKRGAAEWVPAARLRVPWAKREGYLASEDRWANAGRHAPSTPTTDAAMVVLAAHAPESLADLAGNGAAGIMQVFDVDELSRLSGVDVVRLATDQDAFVESDVLHLPWPQTEQVLIGLCRRNPLPVLQWLRAEAAREQAAAEARGDSERRDDTELDTNDHPDARRYRQWRDSARERRQTIERWLSVDSPSLASRYLELERMYQELAEEVSSALPRIVASRSQVANDQAQRLRDLLGRDLPS